MQFRTQIMVHTSTEEYKDISVDVMAWNTSKAFGTPCGSWQMTLSTRPDEKGLTWFDKLNAQDFVRLRISIGDGPFITVMNGLINRVERVTSVNAGGGQVSESIAVIGLDLGKVLTKFHLWYNPYGDGLEGIISGMAIFSQALQGLSVEKALQSILNIILNNDSDPIVKELRSKQGAPLAVYFDPKNVGVPDATELLRLNATVGKAISDTYHITTMQGDIWTAMKRWANEPWNEFFVDNGHPGNAADSAGDGGTQSLKTDDNVTYVNLRPVPFKKDSRTRLVTHDISYEDIQSPFAVSKGDDDVYSAYFAYPSFMLHLTPTNAKAMSGGTVIIQDKDATSTTALGRIRAGTSVANRYGFRILEATSIYVTLGSSDDGKKTLEEKLPLQNDKVESLTNDLVEFFDPNPKFLQCNVRVKSNRTKTLIKIGHRVRITDNLKSRPTETYYVTAVSTEWQFSGSFTQTLRLMRGVVGDD